MPRQPLFGSSYTSPAAFVRSGPGLLLLALLALLFGAAAIRADGPARVGLVVVHGDGAVVTRCVELDGGEITGYDVLDYSGLDLNVDVSGGQGASVCRIDGEGCSFPAEPCFCRCAGGGSDCVYWSYWHQAGGAWRYSGTGASGHVVGHGDVEGWVWGLGSPNEAAPPPLIPFEEICAPPAATPTATPAPTSTPAPTAAPTHTPRPPDIAYFRADRTSVTAGESVSLSWDLSGARAAYLHYDGVEEGVVAPGGKLVSPAKSTVYTLVARGDGGETRAELSITVLPAAETPSATPTATPAPTSPPAPAATATATASPAALAAAATATATPSPPPGTSAAAAAPPAPARATDTPLPSPTPSPARAATATLTPARQAAAEDGALPAPTPRRPGLDTPPRPLLRATPRAVGPSVSPSLLGAVGGVALLAGLAGLAVLVWVLRRQGR